MRLHSLLACLAATALALAPPVSAQDVPAPGYAINGLAVSPPTFSPGPFGLTVYGVTATLSTEEAITFDGNSVQRVSADGLSTTSLGTIPTTPTFPSFVEINPTEQYALIGESSFGGIYRVDLVSGGITFLGTLIFNFDACFETATVALVSANKTGSFTDNHIVRVDILSGAQTDVCFVNGPSGPVAIDALGNLYYGLQESPVSVIVWSAAQLSSGALLTAADALTLASGFAGSSSLAYDPAGGGIYMAVNDFTTGSNKIVQVISNPVSSPVLVEGAAAFNNLGNLEFVGGTDGAVFGPYQPEFGGTLRYNAIDYYSPPYRAAVQPARPEGALVGPGVRGVGPVDFTVSGGPPLGFVQVFFGPTSTFTLPEALHLLPGAQPLFTGLDLVTIDVIPGLFPLDGAGSMSLGTFNPGGLGGLLTVQGLVLDSSALVAGTSTAAHL